MTFDTHNATPEEVTAYLQDPARVIDALLQSLAQLQSIPKSWDKASEAEKEQLQTILGDAIMCPVFALLALTMDELDAVRTQQEFTVAGNIFAGLIVKMGDNGRALEEAVRLTRRLQKELRDQPEEVDDGDVQSIEETES